MIARLKRIAVLAVPRAALLRALVVAGPLIVGLILGKAVKLVLQKENGAIPDDLLARCFELLSSAVLESVVFFLLIIPALLVVAGGVIARRSKRKVWWIAGLPLGYLVVIVGMTILGESDPWHTHLFTNLGDELRRLAQLWWQEAFIASAVIALLSVYFANGTGASARIVRLLTFSTTPATSKACSSSTT